MARERDKHDVYGPIDSAIDAHRVTLPPDLRDEARVRLRWLRRTSVS